MEVCGGVRGVDYTKVVNPVLPVLSVVSLALNFYLNTVCSDCYCVVVASLNL